MKYSLSSLRWLHESPAYPRIPRYNMSIRGPPDRAIIACDGRGKNSGVRPLETIGPSDISPYLHHLLCRSPRKSEEERDTSSRPSGARKFCPKFLNITIPSLFLASSAPFHPPGGNQYFYGARARFFPRSTSHTTHACTHGTLHHTHANQEDPG